MTDHSVEDYLGLEAHTKQTWQRFYTAYNVRRPAQAPVKFDDYSKLQLPNNSVLHTCTGFDTLEPDGHGLADINSPLILNERNTIWLYPQLQMSDESSKPFGVDETYTYRPNKLAPGISHLFQTHRNIHRIIAPRTIGNIAGALSWIDYSPLNQAYVNGILHTYRKFDIIFRTILNNVSRIGNNVHHFIVVPQSGEVYPRSIIQRTFKEFNTSTLSMFKHDPSIFLPIHVMGYIYGKTHDLDAKPYKEDVKILGKHDKSLEGLPSTSLFERLDEKLFDSINFIFYRGNRAIVYNLGDIVKFSEDASFYTKFFRHIMNLRLTEGILPNHIDEDSDQFDTFVSSMSKPQDQQDTSPEDTITPVHIEEPKETIVEKTQEHKPVTRDVVKTSAKLAPIVHDYHPISIPKTKVEPKFESKLRQASATHVSVKYNDDKVKVNKKDDLLDKHLNASIGGKTLSELIESAPPKKITPGDLSFLTHIPEASYQKSSLVSMDKTYQEHAYHQELAKVIASTAKHGFFVTKIDEDKLRSEMDRTNTYKVHLTDLDGKSHHVKFTVPDVDSNGLMKVGGIEYRLTRQAANIPICKISPHRVNLSSYYNKVIIERVQSKRFSYENDISKLIMSLRNRGLVKATVGSSHQPTEPVPFDYSAIGNSFTELSVEGYTIYFGGDHAPYGTVPESVNESISTLESQYGIYVGWGPGHSLLFWDKSNQIHEVQDGKQINSWGSFVKFLVDMIGSDAIPDKTSLEWTQAHILNQTIPLVFILGYKLGLKELLDKINLNYKFYDIKDRSFELDIDDIAIRFQDGTLVFNRNPVARSLIASGLTWVSLKDFQFSELSIPTTYIKIFSLKGMGPGVLKGLRGFFDFFVDDITESVLVKLGEPTNFSDLLLRANVMLTDYHHDESSSVKLHRFRLYERFNGMVYNQIYRDLANYRDSPSSKKSFSINPEAVFQAIVQDATVATNDTINPVHEVKQRANFTFTGAGGRTSNSFVLRDRIYPKDGVGVISDAVPDSGKVGITAYLSASPNIDDIHGLPKPYKVGDELEPPQILSIGAMLMPCSTTDDGKRTAYTSIQISHYVPNHDNGETLSVRTGYDSVLPHLSSDLFTSSAEDDGVVESINHAQRVVKVRYKDHEVSTTGSLKVPYLDSFIDGLKSNHGTFGYLVTDSDIAKYPMGAIFSVTRNSNCRVVDRLRCDTVEAIPDKEIARKQNTLVQEFIRHKHKSLYYVRFGVVSKTTPGLIKSYSYTDVYSPISGAYLLQKRDTNVTPGEKIKRGDIIIYNSGFFVPDPLTKQVTFKHGVTATVALMEKGSNHEDACEISRDFSNKLYMTPCHQREVITKRDAAILSLVKVGDHVETTDSLCIISDEYLIQSHGVLSVDNLDIIEKLNRQTPKADYTGDIRKIRILYACDKALLSESLRTILKSYEREVRQNFNALNNDPLEKHPDRPGYVKPGTKYKGIDFAEDTVILEFMIEEKLGLSEGDKLVISNQAKSIISLVSEKSSYTESGTPIDVTFSTTSFVNRIIASPFLIGIAEKNMEALKEKVLDMYFD